jgi:putative drug exporter of the RND superfamily
MATPALSQRLAHWSAQRPWRVVLCWLVLVTAGLLAFREEQADLRADVALLNEPQSVQAAGLIQTRLAGAPITTTVLCAEQRLSSETRPEGQVDPRTGALLPVVQTIQGCLDQAAGTTVGGVETQPLTQMDLLSTPRDTIVELLQAVQTVAISREQSSTSAGGTPGHHLLEERISGAARSDLHHADRLGMLVAAVVLILLTRALVAPVITMLLSLAAIALALGLMVALSGVVPLSVYVVNIVVMFGLAVGIDYSLVMLHRYREERARSDDVMTAIERSAATAGRTVMLAGSAAVLSLGGLLFLPISIFRSLALGAILAMLMGMVAALTLLPAFLRLAGDRLDWPRKPMTTPPDSERRPSGWTRLSKVVMRRPVLAVAIALGVLAPLLIHAPDLKPGLSLPALSTNQAEVVEAAPPSWEVRTIDLATQLFGVVEIVVDVDRDERMDRRIDLLAAAIGQREAFAPVVIVQWNDQNDLAVVSALLAERTDGTAAVDAVRFLQEELIPQVFSEQSSQVVVGGVPSSQSDVLRVIEAWQWRVVALVLFLSFSLLLVAFRSLAVPIKATAMNLLSTAAALGAVVLVFQKGVGASWFGFEQTDAIEAWVPLLLFCVLVGLSTDYHLFLLGRIRECYARSGDNRIAVEEGMASTGGIITGAALVMVTVFASFATGELASLQQLGFGLAVAILIDATIVRSLLAPALMALLGRWNWYLPACPSWLPLRGIRPAP